jgi:hypothetical protein
MRGGNLPRTARVQYKRGKVDGEVRYEEGARGICDGEPAGNGEVAKCVGLARFGTVGLLGLVSQVVF